MDPFTTDFAILSGAAFLAGAVRGFVGFGAAMVYLPLAARVLDPVDAIASMIVMELIGPLPMMPKVIPHVHRGDLARLVLGTALALPLGLAALLVLDPGLFRIIVAAVSLTMLTGLAMGWRYSGQLRPPMVFGTGAAAGFLGGVAGIPGPPVIFIYMASPHPAQVIRANMTSFLFAYDWMMLGLLALSSQLRWDTVVIGAMLIVPYMTGNLTGTALFDPERERIFRWIAYALIAASGIAGLPVWGG
ncbi:sulfite exporter TauE/SafE family protein [Phaeobacter marinintestinus]|uniref:sulfite exporter TauE/SafE family protein n=1 Tax=Falsiphaeobacter marinintestinus TaxID=1492905 RepID=UPI0011B63F29|nr:sulfite exporter TauE/SafE family protein [Phaeobacter marinintestinus]